MVRASMVNDAKMMQVRSFSMAVRLVGLKDLGCEAA
jgi:hypothetical protein